MMPADTLSKKLALFDFDGTITDRDSLIDFVVFVVGKKKFILGLLYLLPAIVRYKLKRLDEEQLKTLVIIYFFGQWSVSDFILCATQYAQNRLPKIIKQSALARIQWHKQQHHHVVIVTASMKNWISPWCQSLMLGLIATELNLDTSKITGELKTRNCKGLEKVRRIYAELDLRSYEYIYAYGDTAADKPMLSLANESYYQYFRN